VINLEHPDIDTSYDRQNMLSDYASWCDDGIKAAEAKLPSLPERKDGRLYYAGMGASAAPGEVISVYLSADIRCRAEGHQQSPFTSWNRKEGYLACCESIRFNRRDSSSG